MKRSILTIGQSPSSRSGGFSLMELLVVITIIAVLAALLFPVYGRVTETAQRTKCASNMRQLMSAYLAYAGDHNGTLISPGTNFGTTHLDDWVGSGNARSSITQGALYPYAKDERIYRCPSDISDHVRSYSISDRLKPDVAKSLVALTSPAQTLVLMEENDYRGYNGDTWTIFQTGDTWIDFVISWHGGGANLAFADGHVEHWVWTDPRTAGINSFGFNTPNNADLKRLQAVFLPP